MNDIITDKYMEEVIRMTQLVHPNIPYNVLNNALRESIDKRRKDYEVVINNNYTKRQIPEKDSNQKMYIKQLTNYILAKEPICTSWGVLFKHHDEAPNPLAEMIKQFMDLRNIHKGEMFKHPKGTEEYASFQLLQLLDKVDANAVYGVLGQASSIFYNIYVAASITAEGRSLISSVILFFEMFLSNNVKFSSLDEIITYIYNVISEKPYRKYDDRLFLDKPVSREECFAKIIYTCGDFREGSVKWVPSFKDMDVIWRILTSLSQEDINRLYYKNNLIAFVDNTSITNAIIYILEKLNAPFMDPNNPPKEVNVEMETLTDLMREYVYYRYPIFDKIDKRDAMLMNVCAISDTDSAIVCLDGWYRYMLDKVKGMNFNIIRKKYDIEDDYGNEPSQEIDYDFIRDEIITREKKIKLMTVVPQEGLRYSIINIMAHICGVLVNEYMIEYTKHAGSYNENRKCLIISKNEYLMKRALLTMGKKHYVTKLEIQEGNIIPDTMEESLDIKGLEINKSTLNKNVRDRLNKILYDDIINCDTIDQVRVIKDLKILEKQIYQSLQSGDKTYYKPASIKSMSWYDDPMRIQGVKASYIWNIVKDPDLEAIDLSARNTIDIVKVNIDERNVGKIADKYPEVYEKLIYVLRDPKIQNFGSSIDNARTKGVGDGIITALAIPVDVATPKWIMEFIDYTSIINDCLSAFPIESIGITKMNKSSINYTNIISL